MGVEDGDGAVKRHGGVREVFEDVGVEEAVGFVVVCVLSRCCWEGETRRVLGDAVDVPVVGEAYVEG